jgi:hypothetical protein
LDFSDKTSQPSTPPQSVWACPSLKDSLQSVSVSSALCCLHYCRNDRSLSANAWGGVH